MAWQGCTTPYCVGWGEARFPPSRAPDRYWGGPLPPEQPPTATGRSPPSPRRRSRSRSRRRPPPQRPDGQPALRGRSHKDNQVRILEYQKNQDDVQYERRLYESGCGHPDRWHRSQLTMSDAVEKVRELDRKILFFVRLAGTSIIYPIIFL